MASDILVVDDEADIRELIAGILEDEGHRCRLARDSDEALRMAEAGEAAVYEIGLEPSERSMRSAIGLVWRTVIFCLILLAMLTIALWLG